MPASAPLFRKFGKISGKLQQLGRFGQRGTELQYEFLKLEHEDGSVASVERVAMPAELNGLLEIGAPIDLFLARRGMWNFCYAVRMGERSAQSYRGYRLYFIFNRLMMYVNLMFGIYLLMTTGLLWAGIGLLVFGLLFGYMGPASPRRMQAIFAANQSARSGESPVEDKAPGG
ncbi:MAG: hypothetical protein OER43_11725 [Gammaproteobacteria bacterium]|nr:hypothetical protein [Gammaproteobacteria bacterium]MDH3411626.1 hypothetical protein [Gammaproteobacteria bacterium]